MLNYLFADYIAEVQDIFLKILREEQDVSVGVAAIKTLLTVIEKYKGSWCNVYVIYYLHCFMLANKI